ncbi:MAG: DUF3307 domain-containing protein [Brevundimonas sp.]|uniref:DUF3307 domain-containing protein n=1 Tax=Brevundimonas sp. TaxID=1871086 RepID=UPI001A2D0EEF|nr:DUF3307 domain-containing protein [Brevundimonas sp.]MBJ7317157.1 DUF3307 domain-containing protein [Brevundimonas sp.]MDK2745705.1 DUF3307 domain-containing protein [Brevundimonas sp.]
MIETFLLLLTGHLLGDFVFQSDALIARKKTLRGLTEHVVIVTGLTLLLLAPASPLAVAPLALMAVSHFAMDYAKTRWLGDRLWSFSLDQAVHIGVLVALALAWPDLARQSLWGMAPADVQLQIYAALTVVCGVIVGVPVGGVVIKKLVEPLAPTSAPPTVPAAAPVVGAPSTAPIIGMRSAGRYIGWLERGLTITFILIGHPEGVGFLLAAKSILRFRDVQDQTDRHQAEYIIIGTFLSFGWALFAALATKAALAHWLAPL